MSEGIHVSIPPTPRDVLEREIKCCCSRHLTRRSLIMMFSMAIIGCSFSFSAIVLAVKNLDESERCFFQNVLFTSLTATVGFLCGKSS